MSYAPLRAERCPVCGEYPDVGVFCEACLVLNSHPQAGDYAASYWLRLAGELIDLVLFLLLPIWLVWMWFASREGQSPGKAMLGMYVIHESGQPITPQRMWVRELLIKRLLLGLVGYLFGFLGPILNAGWIMFNPDRQCMHDRMVGTLVVVHRTVPRALPVVKPAEPAVNVVMPPPAPAGPPVPRPLATPAPVASNAKPTAASPVAKPPEPTSPLLDALERERERGLLSQSVYERRRRAALEALREEEGAPG